MSAHSSLPRPQQDVSQSKDFIRSKTPNLGWPQARHLPPPHFSPVLSAREVLTGSCPTSLLRWRSLTSVCMWLPSPFNTAHQIPFAGTLPPSLQHWHHGTVLFLSTQRRKLSSRRRRRFLPTAAPTALEGRSVSVRWMSPPSGYRGCIPRHLQHLKPAPNILQSTSSWRHESLACTVLHCGLCGLLFVVDFHSIRVGGQCRNLCHLLSFHGQF